jgi:hypothetical protein
VVIPFDNTIGKDTELYKLYNTNMHEKAEELKNRAESDHIPKVEQPAAKYNSWLIY